MNANDRCNITVIIPVYNTAGFVTKCLDSVINQTYDNLEIICIDDNSADDSYNVLKSYSEKDQRIIIIKNEINHGQGYSRNLALQAAKGDYIYFLDADDWIEKNAIEIMFGVARKNKVDGVLFNSRIYTEDIGLSCPVLEWNVEKKYHEVMTGEDAFCLLMDNDSMSNCIWRQFWRKDFLLENKLFFPIDRHAEDIPFSFKTIISAESIVFIDDVLHTYRRQNGSDSLKFNINNEKSSLSNYVDMLSFWMCSQFKESTNQRVKSYLDTYIRKVYLGYIKYNEKLTENSYQNFIEQHMFNAAINQKPLFENIKFSEEELIKIRLMKHVFIYGASHFALEVYEELKVKGIDIDGFVVTNKNASPSKIAKKQVQQIDKVCFNNDECLFLLGVLPRYKQDIIYELNSRGYYNYILTS